MCQILFDLGYGGENMLYKQGSRFRTVYEIHIYSTAVTSCFFKKVILFYQIETDIGIIQF